MKLQFKILLDKHITDSELSASRLEAKLSKLFGDCICVVKGATQQGNVTYDSRDTASLHYNNTLKISRKTQSWEMLCNVILGSESTRLQKTISLETIQCGTVTTPSLFEKFSQCLAAGPDIRSWKSDTKKQHIQSISNDAMFATSYGCKILNIWNLN